MAAIGATLAWEAVECSCHFCCIRGDYFCDLKDSLKSLQEQLDQLKVLKQQVDDRVVQETKSPRWGPAQAVTYWFYKVGEVEKKVDKVLKEGKRELKKKLVRWFFPKSCCAFNEVGRRVSRIVAEVKELVEEVKRLDPLVERKPPSPVDEWQIGFDPRGLDSKLKKAWRYLEDPSAKIIGIHGPEGVGKTTLLKMINNKLRDTRLGFHVVIRAVLSREGTVKKVQESILNKLEVPRDSWQDQSEADREREILEILRTKKFVLLLDDLQEQSNQSHVSRDSSFIEKREDLIKVGVPVDGNKNGSKVFFTTRSEAFCGKIEADKRIRVDSHQTNFGSCFYCRAGA
uniref:Putative disease resistance protein At1g12280 n=1 Tax=Rhizophora mucronata TaxID=61149 RepID=A0A2P2KUJ8_RHIMU